MEKTNKKTVWNFIARYGILIVLFIVSMVLIPLSVKLPPEFKAVTLAIAYESIALFLCGIANYVYTEIKFWKEQQNILGFVFIGVHILVSITVAGTYWLEFINKTVLP